MTAKELKELEKFAKKKKIQSRAKRYIFKESY